MRLSMDDHDFSRDPAWAEVIAVIETHSGHELRALHGQSVNLEEKIWVKVIAWDNIEVCMTLCI
jgi:hypothetical protein